MQTESGSCPTPQDAFDFCYKERPEELSDTHHLQHISSAGKSRIDVQLRIGCEDCVCAVTAAALANTIIQEDSAEYLVDQLDSPDAALAFVENVAERHGDVPAEVQRDAVLILLRWVEDRICEIEEDDRRALAEAIEEGEAYEDGTPIPYELYYDRYAAC